MINNIKKSYEDLILKNNRKYYMKEKYPTADDLINALSKLTLDKVNSLIYEELKFNTKVDYFPFYFIPLLLGESNENELVKVKKFLIEKFSEEDFNLDDFLYIAETRIVRIFEYIQNAVLDVCDCAGIYADFTDEPINIQNLNTTIIEDLICDNLYVEYVFNTIHTDKMLQLKLRVAYSSVIITISNYELIGNTMISLIYEDNCIIDPDLIFDLFNSIFKGEIHNGKLKGYFNNEFLSILKNLFNDLSNEDFDVFKNNNINDFDDFNSNLNKLSLTEFYNLISDFYNYKKEEEGSTGLLLSIFLLETTSTYFTTAKKKFIHLAYKSRDTFNIDNLLDIYQETFVNYLYNIFNGMNVPVFEEHYDFYGDRLTTKEVSILCILKSMKILNNTKLWYSYFNNKNFELKECINYNDGVSLKIKINPATIVFVRYTDTVVFYLIQTTRAIAFKHKEKIRELASDILSFMGNQCRVC